QDRARLEHRQRTAGIGRRMIEDRTDAIVRRDREERGLELRTGSDVDGNDAVGEAGLLEEHRDLVTVRGSPIIEVDHRWFPGGWKDENRMRGETARGSCGSSQGPSFGVVRARRP